MLAAATKENFPVTRPQWVAFVGRAKRAIHNPWLDSEKTDVESEPAAKKRKLATSGSFGNPGSQTMQSSFTEVLERLKEESGGVIGRSCVCYLLIEQLADFNAVAEGGADDWARPSLPAMNEMKDKLSALTKFRVMIWLTLHQISIPAD